MSSEEHNSSKKNTSFVVALSIIGVLIVLLGFLEVCYLIFKPSDQNVYYNAIDNVANYFGDNIKIFQDKVDNPSKITGSIDFNLKTNDSSLNNLANMLNRLRINVENNIDFSQSYLSSNYNLNYNNSSLINVGTIIKDKDLLISLNELYPKKIKISDFNASPIITLAVDDTYRRLVTEIAEVIKSSLKKDYFSSEKVTLTINNKKVDATNYKLTLKNEDNYEFQYNLLEGLLNNEFITSTFSYIFGIDEKEIKTYLEEARDQVNPEDYQDVFNDNTIINEFNVYMDNSKVLKVEITSNDNNKVEFILDNDHYNIYLNEEEAGKLKINNKDISYELEGDLYNIKFDIAKDNINMEINNDEYTFSFDLKEDEDSIVGSIVISEEDTQTELSMNINLKKEKVKSISIEDVKDYVELNSLTEEDYNTISENLTKMPGLLSLVSDILGFSGSIGL